MSKDSFRPTIVCLSGSTRFKEDFEIVARKQTLKGRIVLTLAFFSQADGEPLTDDQIEMLHHLHRHKIRLADEVHIINKDGYIGESTRSDIEFSVKNDKFIEYMEPIE